MLKGKRELSGYEEYALDMFLSRLRGVVSYLNSVDWDLKGEVEKERFREELLELTGRGLLLCSDTVDRVYTEWLGGLSIDREVIEVVGSAVGIGTIYNDLFKAALGEDAGIVETMYILTIHDRDNDLYGVLALDDESILRLEKYTSVIGYLIKDAIDNAVTIAKQLGEL